MNLFSYFSLALYDVALHLIRNTTYQSCGFVTTLGICRFWASPLVFF